MLINCFRSKRGPVSSSPCVSLCRRTVDVEQRWKETVTTGRALMTWCSGSEIGKIETLMNGGKSG
jgi:hypothetical protein